MDDPKLHGWVGARLPDSAQEIADVIGRHAALYLIGQLPRVYGGSGIGKKSGGRTGTTSKRSSRCVLYVPKRLMPKDMLVRLLGWQDASKLAQEFSGMLIQPANCAEIYRPHRDANIARLLREGLSVTMIAEWFSVSDRTVKNIAAEIPPHDLPTPGKENCSISSKRPRKTNGSKSSS